MSPLSKVETGHGCLVLIVAKTIYTITPQFYIEVVVVFIIYWWVWTMPSDETLKQDRNRSWLLSSFAELKSHLMRLLVESKRVVVAKFFCSHHWNNEFLLLSHINVVGSSNLLLRTIDFVLNYAELKSHLMRLLAESKRVVVAKFFYSHNWELRLSL
jgi:hypothetical protein